MKITIGELKQLIKEAAGKIAAPPDKRAMQVTQNVVDVAEDYVDSLVAGHPDKASEAQFKELADQSASMAQWMLKRQDPHAEEMARFAKVASQMADSSGFWKRPAFLGHAEYVEKMQTMLRRLNTAAIGVLSN